MDTKFTPWTMSRMIQDYRELWIGMSVLSEL